ncbi:hypothetical protein QQ045_023888 [Rhodiola kirilowii]
MVCIVQLLTVCLIFYFFNCTVIVDELSKLEQQRISIEEREKKLQEAVQDEKRAVDRKAVRKFEMDAENQTAFDTCNMLWKTIDM